MKIKTKLTLGIGTLFLMVFSLAALSGWYIHQLKKDTDRILTTNYNSLLYARNMLVSLEAYAEDDRAVLRFQDNLIQQQRNITEAGEKEKTADIAARFEEMKQGSADQILRSSIRKDITDLMQMNIEAIARKSGIAGQTAKDAIISIAIVGTVCFVIAFTLLLNLPSNIADPVRKLTESIRQIARQNYRERVHILGSSEFAELASSFNTMAEKLEEYAESQLDDILQNKRRIEALVENMSDPVIGADENRTVIFANEQATKILGLSQSALLGKPVSELTLHNDLLRDLFKDISSPSAGEEFSSTLKIFADGRQSYFEKEVVDINVVPTGENELKYIGQVIMLKNITPFKEMDLAKTNFIGTVSHEFKTPIAAIQMGIQLLQNDRVGKLNDEQKYLIHGIKEDSDRLRNITAELLNIAQVESGAIKLNIHDNEVKPMLEYAIKANQVAADQKQLSLHVSVDADVNKVLADNEKTAWVLTNLISNAIRYSHENAAIEIHVEKQGTRIRFEVKDYGQGIDSKYKERIFERYFRVPGARSGGTGLGLSISKEFIEGQGGEIAVDSELGSGSSFFFYLKEAK
ncbi:HAMP domain-containing sensor histidine kinase [Sphingobacterium deserti]|uniref:histidine kinase n=1 Tax=Sphingobacterium deserti TaxID=1229276 RepID=A0A0B8T664_9SPHI|nr:ATP-binding protein [Sphingobacterium deserti]KGE12550.1 PAS/PAC sensor signal transduction histidine kinase [Sphingobacterium deserti]